MHLLAPFHASFMYGQHKFGAACQAVEALHHKPRFTGGEMDRRSHQERVAEVLTWIARTVLLAAAGGNDVDRCTVARAAFQHAVEQLGPAAESVSGSG